MGFSGGGSSQTTPHTHDSTVVNDGGSLNFDNVTQGSLTAGDLTYSDGSHLQRLQIGAVGETLAVSAGSLPEWASASGAPLTFIGSDTVTTPRNSMSVSFPTISGSDLGQLTACFSYQAITSPATWRIRVNGISTAGFYNTQRMSMNAGITGDLDTNDYLEGMPTGARQSYGIINFQCGTQEATTAGHDTTMVATGYGGSETPGFRGWQFTCVSDNGGVHGDDFNSFDEIELYLSGGNIQTGGRIAVWKTSTA